MAANVNVKRYPSRYHQGRTSTAIPKNLFKLVPKARRLPWTSPILEIVDDEYFWIEEERLRSSERKARSSGYKVILLKKNHCILPTMP
jgi:hypothetical protein